MVLLYGVIYKTRSSMYSNVIDCVGGGGEKKKICCPVVLFGGWIRTEGRWNWPGTLGLTVT